MGERIKQMSTIQEFCVYIDDSILVSYLSRIFFFI
jgi:hypothetical protein